MKECSVRDDMGLFPDKLCDCTKEEKLKCLKEGLAMKNRQLELCLCGKYTDGTACDNACHPQTTKSKDKKLKKARKKLAKAMVNLIEAMGQTEGI